MKPSEILSNAKQLISKPECWTQGAIARDSKGTHSVPACSDEAVCWCSFGALVRVTGVDFSVRCLAAFFLDEAIGENMEIEEFNDTHSHRDVMEAFDKAIVLAKEENQ